MRLHYLTTLLGIQGYRVIRLAVESRSSRPTVVLELQQVRRSHECGGCHRQLKQAHSSWWIQVQHLTWWQYPTVLRVRRYRVQCPRCGLTLAPLPCIAEGARVTRGLAALVGELCKVMTLKAVAALQGLHRGTVKALDTRALQQAQATRPLEGITVLGGDEAASCFIASALNALDVVGEIAHHLGTSGVLGLRKMVGVPLLLRATLHHSSLTQR